MQVTRIIIIKYHRKMDLQTTIIGIALIALCVIPLAWAYRKRKEKQQKLVTELKAHAITNSCNITRFDLWHNTAIGIDDANSCLFFLRKSKDGEVVKQAHLAGVSSSYTNGDDRPSESPGLELVLVHGNVNAPNTVLEFYNRASLMQLNNELELLKKWHSIVEEHIKR